MEVAVIGSGSFHENLTEVRRLGFDERCAATWRSYLTTCEAGFRTRYIGDVPLVLTRPQNPGLEPLVACGGGG